MSAPIYFFGCYEGTGHYMKSPITRRTMSPFEMRQTPWGAQIDGRLLDHSINFRFLQQDGWTIISFWDNSVDTRPGSNSAFLCNETLVPAELIRRARETWPEVFARAGFPNLESLVVTLSEESAK